MELVITRHAKQKMDICGIDEDQVKLCIQRGAKSRQTEGFLAVWSYIRVTYKIRGNKYIIKTVMLQD